MALDRRDIEAALEKKGFKGSERDHHFYTFYTTGGQKTSVWTKTSHGSGYKTLSDDLVGKMAKQVGLSSGQFKHFVACTLSQSDVEKILVETGRIVLK